MNEIVTTDNRAVAQTDGQPPTLLNFIATALDRNIDTASLRELLNMQKEVQADQARREYAVAMNACQAEIMPVARTAENKQTNSMYAKLENVDAAIRPIYIKHGFSLSFDEEPIDNKDMMMVTCKVMHVGGHSETHRLNAPPDTMGPKGTPTKTALHGRGSTVTFLRRYLECMIFNVVLRGMDDDGNRGGMRFITQAQQNELAKEMSDLKLDANESASFLDFVGADALHNIDERAFSKAKNALAIKRRNLEKAQS